MGVTFRWRGERRVANARGAVRLKRAPRMPHVCVTESTHAKVARAANKCGLTMGELVELLTRDLPSRKAA